MNLKSDFHITGQLIETHPEYSGFLPQYYKETSRDKEILNFRMWKCSVLGAKLEEGACVGVMSLVKDVILEYMIYAGVPVHRIGERSKEMLRFIKDIEETVIS